MALLISSPGADIMATRAAGDLRARLQQRLNSRLARLKTGQQLALLRALRSEFDAELDFEERFTASLSELYERLDRATHDAELAAIVSAFPPLATEHFGRRGSVSALQSLCTTFRVRLLQKALALAEASPRFAVPPPPNVRYTILAAGCIGRREQNLSGTSAHFLIYDGRGKQCDEYFGLLTAQLVDLLHGCGLPACLGSDPAGDSFWHGSIFAWQGLMEERLQPPAAPHWRSLPVLPTLTAPHPAPPEEEEYGRMLETLADLRPVAGDQTLAATLTEFAADRLKHELSSDPFHHLAKRVATMPVARGIFGWFRVALSGEHRGEFNLEQMAMAPLTMAVRMMALKGGIRETGTCQRIKQLCARQRLSIELSERLLLAFQEFGRHRIELEMDRDASGNDFFFNPEESGEGNKERVKHGLEAVVNLQRLLYQELAEAG